MIMVEVPDGSEAVVTGPARFRVITDVPGSVEVRDAPLIEPEVRRVLGEAPEE